MSTLSSKRTQLGDYSTALLLGILITASSLFLVETARANPGQTTSDDLVFEQLYSGSLKGLAQANLDKLASLGQGVDVDKVSLGQKTVRYEVDYSLSVRTLPSSAAVELKLYQFTWRRIWMVTNGKEQPEVKLEAPDPAIVIQMNPDGGVDRLWFPDEYPSAHRQLARKVIATIQFLRPGITSSRWTTVESDTDGEFQVEYRVVDGGCLRGHGRGLWSPLDALFKDVCGKNDNGSQGIRLEKRSLAHIPGKLDWTDEMSFGRRTTPSGVLNLVVKQGELQKMSGDVVHTDQIGGDAFRVASRTAHLELKERRPIPLAEQTRLLEYTRRLKRVYSGSGLHEPGLSREVIRGLYRQQVGTGTYETISKTIDTCVASADNCSQRERVGIFQTATALVFLNPELSDRLGKTLLSQPGSKVRDELVGGSLKEAGHTSAQAALVSVIKQLSDESERKARLVDYVCQVNTASPETVRVISEYAYADKASPLRYTSRECIGYIAGQLRDIDEGRAQAIVAELVRELQRSDETEHQLHILSALGYAGTGRVLTAVGPRLQSTDEIIRAAAFYAIRRVRDPVVDRLLVKAAKTDPSPSVREAVAAAFGVRPPTDENMGAQFSLVQDEEEIRVRQLALKSLWRARFMEPEVLLLIRWVVETESEGALKSLAREMLESLEPSAD